MCSKVVLTSTGRQSPQNKNMLVHTAYQTALIDNKDKRKSVALHQLACTVKPGYKIHQGT